ncbi:MAG: preprotein translocase subunit SecA [Vampirovibrionales bacterium]
MIFPLLDKLFGSPNERKIRSLEPIVDDISSFEPMLERLSDDELRAKTAWFQQELANRSRESTPEADYKAEQELLDTLLPEAFAVCREGAKRVLGMRHYDVQLIGGYILHKGGIAEMRTGEGKTLVATLPAYLNALTGKGVHVVTVNDYLAKRDSEWMGQLYQFLGLTCGLVTSAGNAFVHPSAKKQAYECDITYGTNNEFGFDYLRDNMATSLPAVTQRPYQFAIVDEVDSILIDEARTPLIISGKLENNPELYIRMAALAPRFTKDDDYEVDEKAKNIILHEEAIEKAQALLGVDDLFDVEHNLAHHLLCALKAKELYRLDVDYVVKDDEIVIVDEFTGRLMEGRRWADGIHQAVEAKEGVTIQDETQTLASITYQNLFRLYPKLAGMTGTAMTEAAEFSKIYNLEVTRIPTNRNDQRKDFPDLVFKNQRVKYFKVAEAVVENYLSQRPTLVGTASIDQSEYLSELLSDPKHLFDHALEKTERLLVLMQKHAPLAPMANSLTALAQQGLPAQRDAWQTWFTEATPHLAQYPDVSDLANGLLETMTATLEVQQGIEHHVLNAKHHENEAHIIAQAGRRKAVTIATNMAGRGTDILLGGNPALLVQQQLQTEGLDWRSLEPSDYQARVASMKAHTDAEGQAIRELGGLMILGTERHESRRIDNQLRGRAGRQGDPGSTCFFLSLEDSLMRLFGGSHVANLMSFLQVDETLPLSAPMVNKAIESAQTKVEAHHFDVRKSVLEYDDVLTEQRALIYAQRKRVLGMENLRTSVQHMAASCLQRCVSTVFTPDYEPDGTPENTARLMEAQTLAERFLRNATEALPLETLQHQNYTQLLATFAQAGETGYLRLEDEMTAVMDQLRTEHGIELAGEAAYEYADATENLSLTPEALAERNHPLRQIERDIVLRVVDARWIDYLHNLDLLRQGIGLRAYGQKDPVIEYKREAYQLFQNLTYQIQDEVVAMLFRSRIEVQIAAPPETMMPTPPPLLDETAVQALLEQLPEGFAMAPDEAFGLPQHDELASPTETLHGTLVEVQPWPMPPSQQDDEATPRPSSLS